MGLAVAKEHLLALKRKDLEMMAERELLSSVAEARATRASATTAAERTNPPSPGGRLACRPLNWIQSQRQLSTFKREWRPT